jgi:hypothetical protein
MNFYDNIFYVLWEHLENFEMNLMSMEYPKTFLNNVINIFHYKNDLLKDLKLFENDFFMGKLLCT